MTGLWPVYDAGVEEACLSLENLAAYRVKADTPVHNEPVAPDGPAAYMINAEGRMVRLGPTPSPGTLPYFPVYKNLFCALCNSVSTESSSIGLRPLNTSLL